LDHDDDDDVQDDVDYWIMFRDTAVTCDT